MSLSNRELDHLATELRQYRALLDSIEPVSLKDLAIIEAEVSPAPVTYAAADSADILAYIDDLLAFFRQHPRPTENMTSADT